VFRVKLLLVTDPGALPALAGEFMSPVVSLPEVNWNQEAALVIDMGEQRTGGFGVTVTGVRQSGPAEVELQLQVRRPGRGDFVAQVITHPHAVAKVPRAWLEGGATVVARDQNGNEVLRQAVAL
jgi:hypothetical protein